MLSHSAPVARSDARLVQRSGQAAWGAGDAAEALKVLANEDRLRLLWQLSRGESTVGQLGDALDIHQPTLSQQLRVLRNKGFVKTRRDGKHVCYSLADPAILQILQLLHRLHSKAWIIKGAPIAGVTTGPVEERK